MTINPKLDLLEFESCSQSGNKSQTNGLPSNTAQTSKIMNELIYKLPEDLINKKTRK